MLYSTKSKNFS